MRIRFVSGLALLALLPQLALAQGRPNTRQGLWVGLGLGVGSAGADCTGCSSDRTNGLSGYFRIGGTVSPSFLIGFETNGWAHSESGVDESIGVASVVGYWYPSRSSAFYLKLGLGGLSYKADDGVDDITTTGASAQLGLGYEIRVARNTSIALYLNSIASSKSKAKFNGISLGSAEINVNLVQLGVGVTFH